MHAGKGDNLASPPFLWHLFQATKTRGSPGVHVDIPDPHGGTPENSAIKLQMYDYYIVTLDRSIPFNHKINTREGRKEKDTN